MRSYHDRPGGTVSRARELRREASEPERRLLRALREAFPHLKWRHQTPIGPYYADILCFSERLVIEVDGDTHATAAAPDAARTAFIEREGYRVIRFANHDVMVNTEGVLTQLSLSLWEKEGPHRAGDERDEGVPTQEKGGTA
jgi:very-short-patch-repair endonuclease